MRLRSTEPVEDVYPGLPPTYDGDTREETATVHANVDPAIAVIHAPSAMLAEQARDIQSTLSAMRHPDGRAPGSIAIIAIEASEQAAILTANIAVSAALSGLRTLVVDMEHSGFVQHRLLGMNARTGSPDDMDEPFQLVQPSSIRSLFVMAAPQQDGCAIDGSPLAPLSQRLSSLTAHFDLCLVDASHIDDLAHAAGSADCAIVAVQRDQTSTSELKAVINKMTMLNTVLIGTIMLI